MATPRFYLPPSSCQQATLTLTGGEAHHATRVLRLQPGANATVLDGQGRVLACVVERTNRHAVELAVNDESKVPPPSSSVTLIPALTKTKSFEWILQKATELGVGRIVPVLTQRTVPEIPSSQAAQKQVKWQAILIEALKQSGSAWLPEVTHPLPFADLLRAGDPPPDLALVGSLSKEGVHPRARFQKFTSTQKRVPGTVAIWIGPEGDFTPEELDALEKAGVLPITLGPAVLRAETAALVALAVVQAELAWLSRL